MFEIFNMIAQNLSVMGLSITEAFCDEKAISFQFTDSEGKSYSGGMQKITGEDELHA